MLKRNLNVRFADVDGGDFSPIPNAYCEFIVSNDLKKGKVLYFPALADFMDDGILNRSDLSEIAEDIGTSGQRLPPGRDSGGIRSLFQKWHG